MTKAVSSSKATAPKKSNVTRFPKVSTSPHQLDKSLYTKINRYVEDHSWRHLAAEVKAFVHEQYTPAYSLVTEGRITATELEREIKSYIPSRTYIEDYAKGRPICYRYTNTLANFFQQRYALENHNPCDEFLMKLDAGIKP